MPLDGGEQVLEVRGAGGATRDERHVTADDDLRLLVVGGDHVRRGEHVQVGVGLEGRQQHRVRRHFTAVGQLDHLVARRGQYESRDRRRIGERTARGQRQVRLREPAVPVELRAALELDAERAELVDRRLEDDRLDEDLAPADVELLDDAAERRPVLGRGAHDERVGRGVRGDADGRFERNGGGRAGGGGLGLRRRRGGRGRCAHTAVVADGRLGQARAAARERAAVRPRLLRRWRRAAHELREHADQARCVGVAERIDIDARRPRRRGGVEPRGDGARPADVVGAADEHERVRPGVGDGAEAARAGGVAGEGFAHALGELVRRREAQRDALDGALARRRVEVVQQACDALDVGRGVDDHERVRRRVGRQQAVLGDERLQHGNDGRRVGVVERQDAGHHLVGGVRARGERVARRHDLHERPARHRGEALHLQDGLEDDVRLVGGDARGREDGHLAAHAVVDDEVPSGDLAHELGEHGQLDVLEVERDGGLVGRARGTGEEDEEAREGPSHRRS